MRKVNSEDDSLNNNFFFHLRSQHNCHCLLLSYDSTWADGGLAGSDTAQHLPSISMDLITDSLKA